MTDEKISILRGAGLTKIFGIGRQKTLAVDHVDFDFYAGEIVSIVGESGSGKTTLAKMLLGLISSTEGDIYYHGQKRDISSQKKKKEYWQGIQAIFQDPFSSFNTFNKIDLVLLDCINMRGGRRTSLREKIRDDDRGLRLCQFEVRGIDEQVSLRTLRRANAALDDCPHLPAGAEDPAG